jgi:hypothetical protein
MGEEGGSSERHHPTTASRTAFRNASLGILRFTWTTDAFRKSHHMFETGTPLLCISQATMSTNGLLESEISANDSGVCYKLGSGYKRLVTVFSAVLQYSVMYRVDEIGVVQEVP